VNVPVKLYSAVSKKTVRFNQLHDADGVRIQQKRVCPADGEEVPYENIVKGYEIAPDKYVVITPEELEAIDPKKTRSIDIEDFVDLDEIDPLYYEHPYYLVPDTGAAKAYRLLLDALRETNKVAIARVVLARQLIEAQATEFDPTKYRDEYRERVLDLIERKAQGEDISVQPDVEEPTEVPDLMAALEASLAAASGTQASAGNGAAKAKKPAAKKPAAKKAPAKKAPAKKPAARKRAKAGSRS
jgi:DNA end-binding protein Ku